MDSIVNNLNNKYLVAIIVGLFLLNFARGIARR